MFLVSIVNNLFIQIMYMRTHDWAYVSTRVLACAYIYIVTHVRAHVFAYVRGNDRVLPGICFFSDMFLSTKCWY